MSAPAFAQTITTTTVSDTVNPSVYGQSVTINAQVTSAAGTPTGSVGFDAIYSPLDGTHLGTVALSSGGTASITVTTLPVGSYTLQAQYTPADSGAFWGSAQTMTQTVNKANTAVAVASTQNPAGFGQSLTINAAIGTQPPGSGTASGTVVFTVDGVDVGTAVVDGSGHASLPLDSLGIGSHAVVATYAGDMSFSSSAGSTVQIITLGASTTTLTTSLNPATAGQSIDLTATVAPGGSGIPTGLITFSDGGAPIGQVALSNGTATLATSALAAGTHTLAANYGGDDDFNSSNSVIVVQAVNKANSTTEVISSLNPSTFGESVTFVATLSPTSMGVVPTGSVVFSIDGTPVATVPLAGLEATYTTSTLTATGHSVTATYSGDANLNGNFGVLANGQAVSKAGTLVAVTSSQNPSAYGQVLTFNVSITVTAPGSGVPSGTVTFFDNGNTLGSLALPAGGTANLVSPVLVAGNHLITASYNGDTNFVASTAPLVGNPQTINQASTAVSLSTQCQTEFVENQPFTYFAAVTGYAPTGTVNFVNGTTTICSNVTVVSGSASCMANDLAVQSGATENVLDLTANYSGDANHLASTAPALSVLVLSATDVIFRSGLEEALPHCPIE